MSEQQSTQTQLRIGVTVWCVHRYSKYLFRLHSGMLIGVDEQAVCYAHGGVVSFAQRCDTFLTESEATAHKIKLENESDGIK